MTDKDDNIRSLLQTNPEWLARIASRLSGYPNPNACWLWPGSKSRGYGTTHIPRRFSTTGKVRTVYVHRVLWFAQGGTGLTESAYMLDHDGPNGCHNPACSNPEHLQAATHRTNTFLTATKNPVALNMRKTHCLRGHPLVEGNLIHSKLGYRTCARCRPIHKAAFRAKHLHDA
jgi:hypothetical protein